MRTPSLLVFICSIQFTQAQLKPVSNSSINVRMSLLMYPFTPIVTIEVRTIRQLTIQFETNFENTHGVTLKYFIKNRMDGHYAFTGLALVENNVLRRDKKTTYLFYTGYGYAHRFGNRHQWTFDNRIGIGPTINADKNFVYPVIKSGIGYIF